LPPPRWAAFAVFVIRMSLSVLYSRALTGVRATLVTVEAHLAGGLPAFTIVGLPETEVRESRDRVRAAILNANFEFPARRITVNLAPADLPKEGGRFDLPIALGILAASGQVPAADLARFEFSGELALNGELREITGVLPMVLAAAREGRSFVLPHGGAALAALVEDAQAHPARTLLQVCAHLSGAESLPLIVGGGDFPAATPPADAPDFAEVRGQRHAKRALEVAAAGGHSVLMMGPPGAGKSMLATRLPYLMPPLTEAEGLETAAVRSLTSAGFKAEQWRLRPYRSPHHSASAAALVGGGTNPRPGEISLAHNGVLFLDELPEFDRGVLETLREPLESGEITISRAARQADFPARFQLVAAMNPCPCGYLGHPQTACRCTPANIARYRGRISGPLIDRIDIQIEVPAIPGDELLDKTTTAAAEPSAEVRARAAAAREFQRQRQGRLNARLSPREVDRYCVPEEAATRFLRGTMSQLNLSARAYHRVLKVARTIADLRGHDDISPPDIAEAVQYRRLMTQPRAG
jgi:magnesium chelatase family protein